MSEFLKSQLDFVYLFYGLAFILLAAICTTIPRDQARRLPWLSLGLFGLIHGIGEWLDMLAMSTEDNIILASIRLGMMALSFVFLFDFGREGLCSPRGTVVRTWVYVPLLLCAVAGSAGGISGINAAIRYTFGLLGGLLAAAALLQASRTESTGKDSLAKAAIAMAAYAIATGFVVPAAPFLPASLINHDSFLLYTGAPVQLIRGILALCLTVSLWSYVRQRQKKSGMSDVELGRRDGSTVGLAFAIAAIFVTGWFFAQHSGKSADEDAKARVVTKVRIAAAGIDSELVRQVGLMLPGQNQMTPTYLQLMHLQLRQHLARIAAAVPNIHRFYLILPRDSGMVFMADSAPEGDPWHSELGAAYEYPSQSVPAALARGEAVTAGPYSDKRGLLVSGFTPLKDASDGQVLAVLGLDIDAGTWAAMIAERRLISILIVLLITAVLLGYFVVRERISERKQADQALHESTERCRILFEQAGDIILQLEMTTEGMPVIRDANSAAFRLLGYERGELIGQPMSFIEAAPDALKVAAERRRSILSGTGKIFQASHRCKNGAIRDFECSVTELQIGPKTFAISVERDITERKLAEQSLRRSEEQHRALYTESQDAIMILTPEKGFISGNPAAIRMFACRDEQDFTIRTPADLSPEYQPDGARSDAKAQEMMRLALEKGSHFFEWMHRKVDGTNFPATVLLSRFESDGARTIQATVRDITESEKGKDLLCLAREVLERLNHSGKTADTIRDILLMIKKSTGIEAVGLRLREGDDFPYYIQDGFSDDFLRTENTLAVRAKNGGFCRNEDGSIGLECTCGLVLSGKTDPANPLFTKGGSCWTNNSLPLLDLPADRDPRLHPRNRCVHDGFLSVALIPVRSDGEIIGLLHLNGRRPNQFTLEIIRFFEGLCDSIGTALSRQSANEALHLSHEALSRRNAELQDFYHIVSHELKTPLTSAREFASILLDGIAGPLTDDQKQYLQLIRESCDQLQFCVTDLIEATRLETGKLELHSVDTSVKALVANVVGTMMPAMKAKGIDLRGEVEPALSSVPLDERRITQVCTNLLGNALKFTPAGGVVTVKVGNDPENAELIRFSVSDTGRGIATKDLTRVFDKLYQVRETDTSIAGGVGLGLYIASGIVRLHGGRMWAESTLGRGSTFHFTLPRRAWKPRRHILFVDDEMAARKAISTFLEHAGFEVSVAGDGDAALEIAQRQPVDLAIVDLCLLGMSGPNLMRELREKWSDLPLVLYTAYPDSQLMEHAMEVTPLTLLTKTCSEEKLIATIRALLSSPKAVHPDTNASDTFRNGGGKACPPLLATVRDDVQASEPCPSVCS